MANVTSVHLVLSGVGHVFERALVIFAGLVMMIMGLGLGVTIIMLPVGLTIGLIGVAMFVGGAFVRLDGSER